MDTTTQVRLCWDIECDGFNPTEIFVLGILDIDTEEYQYYTDYIPSENNSLADGLFRLQTADVHIGHNLRAFDCRHVTRLADIDFDPDSIYDTLEHSRFLVPHLKPNHKLSTWGEIFQSPKGDWKDFSKFDVGMLPYCEQDVRLTAKLAKFLMEQKHKLRGQPKVKLGQ